MGNGRLRSTPAASLAVGVGRDESVASGFVPDGSAPRQSNGCWFGTHQVPVVAHEVRHYDPRVFSACSASPAVSVGPGSGIQAKSERLPHRLPGLRIAFAGSGAFGVPALRRLAETYGVLTVVSQPDRPAGRGLHLAAPPAKEASQELGIPVIQPRTINAPSVLDQLRALDLDFFVVAAFGQFLRAPVLTLPKYGCVNIHASLLPKYRGAAPVAWAIIRGEREAGITTFVLDEGMDTGPLLLQKALPIGPDETAGELGARLAVLGSDLIVETLEKMAAGALMPQPQSEEGTLAPKLHREDGRIRWEWEPRRIHDLVRGTHPWPGAHTALRDKPVKVRRTRVVAGEVAGVAGGTVLPPRDRLLVATGSGIIEILELQPAGCRPISGREFLNGYCRVPGERFV
ncbi:TPA: methionyl-tRNA formyltransferase [Candidatus Acetothermia bacterium]|nr:methionyl-tRNA formyltransferase [Candidatus Acetothermia bacterium]HAZ30216.1 methionyl-tRNA formyltransferase [Candidatus Acetothermia bacterium]